MSDAAHFRLLAHTADIGLEATAPTRQELFAVAARGLRAMLFGAAPAAAKIRLEVSLEADNDADLMVAWLNEILCLCEMTRLVPADVTVIELSDQRLRAAVSGEPFDPGRHEVERSAKAVTYHQAVVEERGGGWYARVYIDL